MDRDIKYLLVSFRGAGRRILLPSDRARLAVFLYLDNMLLALVLYELHTVLPDWFGVFKIHPGLYKNKHPTITDNQPYKYILI